MTELSTRLSDEDLFGSTVAREVLDKMHSLVAGKYFNNKEQVLEGFLALLQLMNLQNDVLFVNSFLGTTCLQQVEKNIASGNYKIAMLKCMLSVLEASKSAALS
jgi:hypothetical protein